MEQKKTAKANLVNKRGYFFEIGLVIALLSMWCVFEWNAPVEKAKDLGSIEIGLDDEDMPPITISEEPKMPPPPPAQIITDFIEIVDNGEEVEDFVASTEVEETTAIEVAEIKDVEQDDEIVEDPPMTFTIVEDMPSFPGGDLALRKYIAEHVRYPESARDNDTQGTVYVHFVVDTDGSVTDVSVMRGVDPLLDKEAVRVISNLPKWKPGMQRGKAVRVSHSAPIKFVLQK